MPRYFRKVIRIRGEDSPNVRWALAEQALGMQPSNRILVEGVLPWADYVKRRQMWDEVRQCIGLDARFWEGAEMLLYPPEWLNRAERLAEGLRGRPRQARAIGVDSGEGKANTSFAAVDEWGLVEMRSSKTPDTSVIVGESLAFMRRHNVPPEKVVFDRGGGGKQHTDLLRAQGFNVRSVAFGESLTPDPKHGKWPMSDRKENREERYAYVNRRAQMYGELRLLLDPSMIGQAVEGFTCNGFAIPASCTLLRSEMAPIPLTYDPEGRLELLPKSPRGVQMIADVNGKASKDRKKTLIDLIGHSPDELDALVLAVHGMLHKAHRAFAGAI